MSLLFLEDSNEEPIPLTQTTVTRGVEASPLFPFRVKHLGKSETYTLYTRSLESKITWCEQIIAAIQAHASNEETSIFTKRFSGYSRGFPPISTKIGEVQ